MKNYSHLIAKLFGPLLIHPVRAAVLMQLLEAKLAGGITVTQPRPKAMEDDGDEYGNPKPEDTEPEVAGKTLILPVRGTLVMHPEDIAMSECGCALEDLNAMIDKAEADPRIDTVVYDFRTPGGTITGIPETGRKILYSRKKTIAFTDSECCSGGLWLAEQCERFYATQSSRVGSCGVYCMTLDMSEALKQDGMKVNAIFAGKYKLLGASFKPLGDDERAILQAGVDKIYDQFKQAMVSQRAMSDEHFGNGLCFDGDGAADRGFTDGVVESLDEILDGMVE